MVFGPVLQMLHQHVAATGGSPGQRSAAAASSALLGELEAKRQRVLDARLDAVAELRRAGLSYDPIAAVSGISKSRIAQLARLPRFTHPPEGATVGRVMKQDI